MAALFCPLFFCVQMQVKGCNLQFTRMLADIGRLHFWIAFCTVKTYPSNSIRKLEIICSLFFFESSAKDSFITQDRNEHFQVWNTRGNSF